MKQMILGLALTLSLGTACFANEATAPRGPLGVVKSSMDRVLAIVQASPIGSDERRAGIVRVSQELFDFNELARRTLGQHWKGLSLAEQAEFVQLFTEVLERGFVAAIEGYTNENVAFFGEVLDGTYAQVRSRITSTT